MPHNYIDHLPVPPSHLLLLAVLSSSTWCLFIFSIWVSLRFALSFVPPRINACLLSRISLFLLHMFFLSSSTGNKARKWLPTLRILRGSTSGNRESALSMCKGSRRSNLGDPKHAMRRKVNWVEVGCWLLVDWEFVVFTSADFVEGMSS